MKIKIEYTNECWLNDTIEANIGSICVAHIYYRNPVQDLFNPEPEYYELYMNGSFSTKYREFYEKHSGIENMGDTFFHDAKHFPITSFKGTLEECKNKLENSLINVYKYE